MRTELGYASGVLTLCVALVTGCGDPGGPSDAFVMSATVNSAAWQPVGPSAPWASVGDGSLAVSGNRSTGSRFSSIFLILTGVSGPGSYALGDFATGSYASYTLSIGFMNQPDHSSTSYGTTAVRTGLVIVTALDVRAHTIAGTFRFEAATGTGEYVVVSDGVFSGRYR